MNGFSDPSLVCDSAIAKTTGAWDKIFMSEPFYNITQ